MIDALDIELRLVARRLQSHAGITLLAVVTVAAAIGATVSVLRALDLLLFRPPRALVEPEMLFDVALAAQGRTARKRNMFSHAEVRRLQDVELGAQIAAFTAGDSGLVDLGRAATGEIRVARASRVSAGFLALVTGPPIAGRYFVSDPMTADPSGSGVVLSNDFWQSSGGAAALPVGSLIRINDAPYTVLGVATKGFSGLGLRPVALWLPLNAAQTGSESAQAGYFFQLVVRLPGQEALAGALARLTTHLVGTAENLGGSSPNVSTGRVELRSIQAPRWGMRAYGLPIAVLVGVGCLFSLLISAGSLATLLLLRVSKARKGIAVQLALGCTRKRLVFQHAAEGMAIAICGGGVGLVLAGYFDALARRAFGLIHENPAGVLEVRSVMIAGSAIALVALLGTLFPAWQVFHFTERGGALNVSEGAARGFGTHRIVLVVQIAIVFCLLASGGLFLRSLQAGLGRGIGVDVAGLAFAELSPAAAGRLRSPIAWPAVRDILEQVRTVPGVRHAALSSSLSLSSLTMIRVRADGLSEALAQGIRGPFVTAVTDEYFPTVGTRLQEGRTFSAADVAGSELVALAGRTMARSVWPQGALGQCLDVGPAPFRCHRIVGIVEDIPVGALREAASMEYYLAAGQHPELMAHPYLFMREDQPSLMKSAVEPVLARLTDGPPVLVRPFAELLEPELRPWRTASTVIGAYGLLALILAGTGLFSVMAYSAQQRRKEFAVRLALGAAPSRVSWLIVQEVLTTTTAGIVIGLGLLALAHPFLEGLLFRTRVFDPGSLAIAALVLVLASIVSVAGPVLSASRTDIRQVLAVE